MTRHRINRWAFSMMCFFGGTAISLEWPGHMGAWIGGCIYGIGIGRMAFTKD